MQHVTIARANSLPSLRNFFSFLSLSCTIASICWQLRIVFKLYFSSQFPWFHRATHKSGNVSRRVKEIDEREKKMENWNSTPNRTYFADRQLKTREKKLFSSISRKKSKQADSIKLKLCKKKSEMNEYKKERVHHTTERARCEGVEVLLLSLSPFGCVMRSCLWYGERLLLSSRAHVDDVMWCVSRKHQACPPFPPLFHNYIPKSLGDKHTNNTPELLAEEDESESESIQCRSGA